MMIFLIQLLWAEEVQTPANMESPSVQLPAIVPTMSPGIQALHTEIERGMRELHIEDQPKPYWMEGNLKAYQYTKAVTSNGQLTSTDNGHYRNIRLDVRVGSLNFDNSNIDSYRDRGVRSIWLPIEDDRLALQRDIWRGMDSAYKDAVETYAQKESGWEGRDYPERSEMLPYPEGIQLSSTENMGKSVYTPVQSPNMDWCVQSSLELSRTFNQFPELDSNFVFVYTKNLNEEVLNTEGVYTTQSKQVTIIRAKASIKAEDGSMVHNTRSWVVSSIDDLPPMTELKSELREMARWTVDLYSAPIEEEYLGPVLLEDSASVEVFRQLLQPQLSGTPPETPTPYSDGTLPRSTPTSRMGRRLLPTGWSVVDDAKQNPTEVGAYHFDDQGVPPQRVELVENGVVKDLLMSRIPRDKLPKTTGHARVIGTSIFVAIPSVIAVRPDRHTSQKKLHRTASQLAKEAGLDYYLVIKAIEPLALTEDFEIAFSGDEQLSGLTTPTEIVRRYADGHEEPVRGLRFVGVDRRILKDIVLAGAQQDFVGVMDEADGRYGLSYSAGLPVSWSVPSILISEMELSGHGGGDQYILPPPTLPSTLSE